MPYRRRYRARRRPRRRNNPLATVPRMMPKSYAFKRLNQVATKVFWLKLNGQVDVPTNPQGGGTSIWRTRGVNQLPVPFGKNEIFTLYDQYKILAMKVKWHPANVGIEPGVTDSGIPGFVTQTARGDQLIWSDQRVDPSLQVPTLISEVVSNASARMINPRRPYSRTIYRPKGVPAWGSCVDFQTNPDSWNAAIYMLINNATPTSVTGRPLWYYTLTYKVLVRGRRQS